MSKIANEGSRILVLIGRKGDVMSLGYLRTLAYDWFVGGSLSAWGGWLGADKCRGDHTEVGRGDFQVWCHISERETTPIITGVIQSGDDDDPAVSSTMATSACRSPMTLI